MLFINGLTLLEKYLRYILTFLSMDGNHESSEGNFVFENYHYFQFPKPKVIFEDSSDHSPIR